MESNHFNKPVYTSKRTKKYCKHDYKHKEQQKDKHEDVKRGLQNYRRWGRKVRKSRLFVFDLFFLIMCFILCDYQAKASRYRKWLAQPQIKTKYYIHKN